MAGPVRGAEPTGLGSMESLLRCIFSNPKATFNFIKKRMKSDLTAGQLLVCVNFLFCVLSSLLGLVPCLSSSALRLGEALLTRPQLQGSGRSGLKWLGSLLQRPQSVREPCREGWAAPPAPRVAVSLGFGPQHPLCYPEVGHRRLM